VRGRARGRLHRLGLDLLLAALLAVVVVVVVPAVVFLVFPQRAAITPTIAPPTIAVAAVAGRGGRLALPQPPAVALVPVPVAVSPGRGLLLRLLRQLVLGQRAHVVAGQGVVAVRVAALCGAQPQRLQQ